MNEGVARRIIRALSMLLNRSLVVVLCLPLAMGCYALWDSHMVYERANVEQWQPYKPTEPEPLSFWELQRINPEVRAWLSVYGTNIDYPVCQAAQGSENKYVTTNAKGEYSLSGALFMDTANAAFDEHRYGNLFVNDTDYGLEFFCFLDADAYDRSIYRHTFAGDGEREGYLKLLHERARNWRTGVEIGKDDRIVLLSTCATGYTNAREILVGKICNERFKNPFVKIPNLGTGVDTQEGWLGVPYWCWLALGVLAVFCVIIVRVRKAKRVVE